jgi:D-alanyl-D-alanine carboxypeptidase
MVLQGCGPLKQEEPPAPLAKRLHPGFDISPADFISLIGALPEEIKIRAASRPEYFLELAKKVLEGPEDLLRPVDKTRALPEGYEPKDLVPLKNYPLKLNRSNLTLRAAVLPDLLAMAEAARQGGTALVLSSTYRSYTYQKTIYERNVRNMGNEAADRESAAPGRSQHQLGTAIDFGSITDDFTGTPMEKWLRENAGKYGFSLSYPKGYEEITGYRHESWHYRYIGRHAAEMEREFFGGIQHYLLEFFHNQREYLTRKIAVQ